MNITESKLRFLIREEILRSERPKLSEGLQYHLSTGTRLDNNVYRPGTPEFFSLFNEARKLYAAGLYEATEEEAELLDSDIGNWGIFEGKRVPLDFPMWDESLSEAYADYYPKKQWVSLSNEEFAKYPEISQEVIDIVNSSYRDIGGHANYKTAQDLLNDPDILLFALIDIDEDPEVDAARISKKTAFGLKNILSATDGSPEAKNALSAKIGEDLKTPGFYAEVSGKMANLAIKKHNANIVDDEETVRLVLGKDIVWFGEDPAGYFPGTKGWYGRKIGGEFHEKIMVGLPNVPDKISEAKYKGREVTLGVKGASRSGGR